MAGIAGKATGVVGRNYLRKILWLGRVGFMAAFAEDGGIQLLRCYRCRIIGMLGQRSVAGFTVDVCVLAISFLFENVGMAGFARLVPSKIERAGCYFRKSITPIVPVLSEAFGDQKSSNDQEQEDPQHKDSRQAKKMSRIFESVHNAFSAMSCSERRMNASKFAERVSCCRAPCHTLYVHRSHRDVMSAELHSYGQGSGIVAVSCGGNVPISIEKQPDSSAGLSRVGLAKTLGAALQKCTGFQDAPASEDPFWPIAFRNRFTARCQLLVSADFDSWRTRLLGPEGGGFAN